MYEISKTDYEKTLKSYFKTSSSTLLDFPIKEKKKVAVLYRISMMFKPDMKYTEKEINSILKNVYDDYVLIRRSLIDYQFLSRMRDGSSYWLSKSQNVIIRED